SECPAGRLHLWPEVGYVKVVADGENVPDGASGELVCTGLLNADMPLIRYRIGDNGALAAVGERVDDVLFTSDGRRIGRLNPVFKADLPVSEAQIVQDTLRRVRIRYVPTANFTPEAARTLVERLQQRMGNVAVVLEPVAEVPRTATGKF